jgi:hypothetical protein
MTPYFRRSLVCAALLLLLIPLGLFIRYGPVHLPFFLYKYLGSCLWAAALYWFLATLLPALQPKLLALIASLFAIAVEISRLIPVSAVDAFRLTRAGEVLLGRYFSPKNIAAYLIAISLSALIDARFHPGRSIV